MPETKAILTDRHHTMPTKASGQSLVVIGVNSTGYNERRNFLDLPVACTRFKRVRDINWIPRGLTYRLLGRSPNRLTNTFNDFGINAVSGYHFFNAITPARKPWCVTFESTLPRLDPEWKNGYRWLAAESCKRIIAISERARHLQILEP
jgi:hypothetical protein